jgi:sigma-B regulation protein RsbU (phosphoserine phosphatase)
MSALAPVPARVQRELKLPDAAQLHRLSAFDGDSSEAWHLYGQIIGELYGAVASALVLRPAAGAPRLVALTDRAGQVQVEARDPFDADTAALGLRDLATHALLTSTAALQVDLTGIAGDSVVAALLDSGIVTALPLHMHGRSEHLLLLGCAPGHAFHGCDLSLLQLVANLMSAYLEGALDRKLLVEETIKARVEIRDLADVQRLLLPDNPQIRGLAHACHYQPCATAGGDYYDLMPLSRVLRKDYPAHWPDAFGLILADVSGHGAGAAMEAVQFDAILRTYTGGETPGPAGALTYANRHFFSRRARPHFMTVVSLLHLPQENSARICNAGHLPPLMRRDGRVSRIQHGRDIPIGILREHQFAQESIDTRADDLLVFYTDGITEARNASGQEFGIERLEHILERNRLSTPEALLGSMLIELYSHQGGEIGTDDQTLLVVRLAGPGSERVAESTP